MFLTWIVLSVSFWLTARILPGFELRGCGSSILVAALFGVLHWLIGTLLFWMIGFGTLGLGFLLAFITRWIVSAIVLKLTDALSKSLTIKSFGTAVLAAMLMSLFGTLAEYLLHYLGWVS
jgi:putative membrane protein